MRKNYLAIDGTEFKTTKAAKKHSKKLIEECFSFDYSKPVDSDYVDANKKYLIDFNDYAVNPEETINKLYNVIEYCIKKAVK